MTSFFFLLLASCAKNVLPLSELMLTEPARRGIRVSSYAAEVAAFVRLAASELRTWTASEKGKRFGAGAVEAFPFLRFDEEREEEEAARRRTAAELAVVLLEQEQTDDRRSCEVLDVACCIPSLELVGSVK